MMGDNKRVADVGRGGVQPKGNRSAVMVGVAALALATTALAQPATVKQATTEWAPGVYDQAAKAAEQDLLHRWLIGNAAKGAGEALLIETTASDWEAVEEGTAEERRVRVGVVKETQATWQSLEGKSATARSWGTGETRNESTVWTGSVTSPGATALRVHFTDFALPKGSELYIYNVEGEAFGPYTGAGILGTGDFWAHTVSGNELKIQLVHRGSAKALAEARFTVADVGVLGPRWTFGVLANAPAGKAFCSFNESCIENASCNSIPGAIAAAQDAVAHMQYTSGRFVYICSGGLVADTDGGSQIPYFLTANHCISKGREASSLEAYFQYTTNCNGACYNPVGSVPRTVGSSILSTSRTSDYTLLQLDQNAPAGSAFLGWTTQAVAFSNNTSLYRISHPSGSPQAYSRHSVDTGSITCSSWPRGSWIYSADTLGATEGGSSGSPVLNGNGEIVGQLSGACGTNVDVACDSNNNATVDGAFAAYFNSVSQWLDPNTGCTDNDGDGFCASQDCDDNDPFVNPGASEVCGDGVDNDCSGTADDGCGVCLNPGQSCSSNGDCCSNKCRGPNGNRTCR